jgi:hypothetical protein
MDPASLPVAAELPCVAEIDDVSIYVSACLASGSDEATLLTCGCLRVFAFVDDDPVHPSACPRYYLENNDWSYVLAGQPALRAARGLYLVPSTTYDGDSAGPPLIIECPPAAEDVLDSIIAVSTQLRDQASAAALSDDAVESDSEGTPGTDTGVAAAPRVAVAIERTGAVIASGTAYAASLVGRGLKW